MAKRSKKILEEYARIYVDHRKKEIEYNDMTPKQQSEPGGVALGDWLKKTDPNILALGAEYNEEMRAAAEAAELLKKQQRVRNQEGGALMVPPEMEEIPEDTYIPEEQMNAEASQVPDEQMEDEFVDHVVDTALDDDEQSYLMSALEADERLSEIFDKVVETASEFTGEGSVEGPGTGVSDSIPARLSDGEFVITKKATDQIGADNLQSIMDEAERAFDGGFQKGYAFGGTVEEDEDVRSLLGEKDEEEIKKQMISANRMPSVVS